MTSAQHSNLRRRCAFGTATQSCHLAATPSLHGKTSDSESLSVASTLRLQALPAVLEDIWEGWKELLNQPLNRIKPATRTKPTPPPPDPLPKTDKEERVAKARVVFGSRLAGPGQRQAELAAKSINIAGVLVPPKPAEPDNCCMSGCVNCVWDLYRDELEDWATKSAEARTRLQAQRHKSQAAGAILDKEPGRTSHVATSMDDDGGGSETNWSTGLATSGSEEDLFANIPVGIREFMRTEKRLKQQKLRLAGVS